MATAGRIALCREGSLVRTMPPAPTAPCAPAVLVIQAPGSSPPERVLETQP
jgi:hypothetical protein